MKKGLYDYSEANDQEIEKIKTYLNKRVQNDRENIIQQMELLDFTDGKNLLDLGCGPGGVDRIIGTLNSNGIINAIDIEERFIIEARNDLDDDLKEKIIYTQGSSYQLPYEDNTFDCCYSRLVFDHLADPATALNEIKRVVRPNGKIGIYCRDDLLTCYNPLPRHYYKIMSAYQTLTRFTGGSMSRGRELNQLFSNAHLKNTKIIKYIFDVFDPGRKIMQDEFMMFDDLIDKHILVTTKLMQKNMMKEYYEDIEKIIFNDDLYIALFDFYAVATNNK